MKRFLELVYLPISSISNNLHSTESKKNAISHLQRWCDFFQVERVLQYSLPFNTFKFTVSWAVISRSGLTSSQDHLVNPLWHSSCEIAVLLAVMTYVSPKQNLRFISKFKKLTAQILHLDIPKEHSFPLGLKKHTISISHTVKSVRLLCSNDKISVMSVTTGYRWYNLYEKSKVLYKTATNKMLVHNQQFSTRTLYIPDTHFIPLTYFRTCLEGDREIAQMAGVSACCI